MELLVHLYDYKYEGKFKDDKVDGIDTLYKSNGIKIKGKFNEGKLKN